jgi:hypothetical protein
MYSSRLGDVVPSSTASCLFAVIIAEAGAVHVAFPVTQLPLKAAGFNPYIYKA